MSVVEVPSDSPAAARRRLRLALRRARETKGLTQTQVAEALDWSLSKVQRIESGDVRISSTDLRALLDRVGITDSAQVTRMVELGRAARRKGWWEEPKYRDHLTPAIRQLVQLEGEATTIRVFQPTLVPGALQTRPYAEAVFDIWGDEVPAETRATRIDVRMARRRQIFERPDPPNYHLIFDESILYRSPAERDVMVDQLRELTAIAERTRVSIRIVPYAYSTRLVMLGQFMILDLEDHADSILYRESGFRDELVQEPTVIRRYRAIYHQGWLNALSEVESANLIEQTITKTPTTG